MEDSAGVDTGVGCSTGCEAGELLEESVHPAVMSTRNRQAMMPMTCEGFMLISMLWIY